MYLLSNFTFIVFLEKMSCFFLSRILNNLLYCPQLQVVTDCSALAPAMTKRALVFLAPGFEEVEFTVPVDILRRGGVEVKICSIQGGRRLFLF